MGSRSDHLIGVGGHLVPVVGHQGVIQAAKRLMLHRGPHPVQPAVMTSTKVMANTETREGRGGKAMNYFFHACQSQTTTASNTQQKVQTKTGVVSNINNCAITHRQL